MRHGAFIASLLSCAAFPLTGCERTSQDPGSARPVAPPASGKSEPAAADRAFMETAAQANLAEIDAGTLAEKKAAHPDVRKFAQKMIEDHKAANSELSELARRKGLVLPSEPNEAQKKEAAALAGLNGADFDRKYMAVMVKDHEAAVALFEKNASQVSDADLRDHVARTLPKLRHHLETAREVQGKAGTP